MTLQNKTFNDFFNRAGVDYLLLVCMMLFMLSVLWRDAHSPWAFSRSAGSVADNYFIALNAKNISAGKGWGLYNGREFVPFEREISTGAIVFLPVALAMKFISDLDDARYLGVMLLNVALLGILLLRLRYFFHQSLCRMLWLVIPFMFLAFMREQWYLVLGEVAASLLLLISASYVAEKNSTAKHIIASGVFAGMAMMSKLLTLLCIPWIVMVLFVTLVRRYDLLTGLRKLLPWFAGFCLAPCVVVLWHLAVFKWDLHQLFLYSVDYLDYYFHLGWTGQMESTFCAHPVCLQANFAAAARSWPNHSADFFAGISLLVPVIGIVALFKYRKSPAGVLLIILAGMCLAQLLFFYFNGIHKQSRYYFIGGFVSLFALSLSAVACLQSVLNVGIRRSLSALLIIVVVSSALPMYREKGLADFHADTRAVAAYINQSNEIDEVLWLSSGPQPFPFASYYFNQDKQWLSLYGFIASYLSFNGDKLQADADFYWKHARSYKVLLEQWQDKPESADICVREYFHNARYKVFECSESELETLFINISGGRMRFPKVTP